jgi:hypothetical protein
MENLRNALQKIADSKLPTLYPDKSDMPNDTEQAYELGYQHALNDLIEIAQKALEGARNDND